MASLSCGVISDQVFDPDDGFIHSSKAVQIERFFTAEVEVARVDLQSFAVLIESQFVAPHVVARAFPASPMASSFMSGFLISSVRSKMSPMRF